jgi:hypothetical protein
MMHLAEEKFLVLGGPLSFGYVSGDLRGADNLSVAIPYWRDGKRYIDQAAVLVPSYRLEMVNTFTCTDSGQDCGLLVEPVVGDNYCDRLADRLFCRVTKKAFRALVPGRDDSGETFADNRVFRGFHDRGEESGRIMFRLDRFPNRFWVGKPTLGKS